MSLLNECGACSKSTSVHPYQCSHCCLLFCYQCLIKHHHTGVKDQLVDMVDQIDKILARFLHHAHNQTEWTDHLTDDRRRLKCDINYIERCPKYQPILSLPNFFWLNHVNSLIRNDSFAIREKCFNLGDRL
jgi:hypothetical protein